MHHNTEPRSVTATVTTISVLALLVVWAGLLGAFAVGVYDLSEGQLSVFLLASGIVFGTIGWLLWDR